MTSIFTTKTRCRAKTPSLCVYHGSPLRVETQAEAIATSDAVLKETAGLLVDYNQPAENWNNTSVKRFAHLVTANTGKVNDDDKFVRDVLKARYGIDGSPAFIGAVEDQAGRFYRYRMINLDQHIQDAKRSSKTQTEQDLADTLQTEQLRAEYEAEQQRGYALDALHSQTVTSSQTRREQANDYMARSLAASAQAFRIQQLCDNLGIKSDTTVTVPDGWSF